MGPKVNMERHYHDNGRRENPPNRGYSDRSFSTSKNRERDRDIAHSRQHSDKLSPIKESSNVSLRSRGIRPANPSTRNVWRPISGERGNENHSTSIHSQVSHMPTPPPNPERENMSSPSLAKQVTPQHSGDQSTTPVARRSALERLSGGELCFILITSTVATMFVITTTASGAIATIVAITINVVSF
ncbi:hypothetical protein YC2023_053404 [Brassica napus]